jgi:hypothetical protein
MQMKDATRLSTERMTTLLAVLAGTVLVLGVVPRVDAQADPDEVTWLARERVEREQALEAALLQPDHLSDLLEACDELAPAVPTNSPLLERGYDAAAVQLRTLLQKAGASDSDVDAKVRELERQLLEWAVPCASRVRATYAPSLAENKARRVARRSEQVSKALWLVRRALPGAPLIALSALLSMLCGALDAARFYYQGEALSRIIARGTGGAKAAAASASPLQAVRMLLGTQVLSTLANIARNQSGRLGALRVCGGCVAGGVDVRRPGPGRRAFVRTLQVDLFAALVRQDVEYFETHDLWEARHLIGNVDYVCAGLLGLPVTLAEGACVRAGGWAGGRAG